MVNKEVRKRILFTVCMLLLFAVGSNLPVPSINKTVLTQMFSNGNMGVFELFNLFTGGAFKNFTVLALGITPYITASIIVQLLTIAFPYFENLSKEGDTGRKKMASITRYLAVVLALIQAIGLSFGMFKRAIVDQSAISMIMIVMLLTAGTAFLMWLGEQINEFGVGNGMSLLIFAGIVERLPSGVQSIVSKMKEGELSFVAVIAIVIAVVLLVAGGSQKDPSAVCKEGGRKKDLWWSDNAYTYEAKCCGSYSNHLLAVAYTVPINAYIL